jgi:OOP family OmpA-OmpF porin
MEEYYMRNLHFAAALASAMALSTPASAEFFNFTMTPYVGASAGQSTTDSCVVAGSSCDDSDTAWKVFGGLAMNEYISMEVGYLDLGTVDYSAPTGARETDGMMVDLIGTFALNPSFTVLVRGGMNFLNTEVDGAIAGTPTNNVGDTDISWSLGLGGQFNFNEHVGLRVEWERFFEVGEEYETGEADIDLISAGIVYTF